MEATLLFLYNIGLAILLLMATPILLFKKKTRAGLLQKLGWLSALTVNHQGDQPEGTKKAEQTLWFHTVSVGEFAAAAPFIERLHKKHADKRIVVSTTTEAGNKLARQKVGNFACVIYFPFDLIYIVKKVLDMVKPNMVFMVETELWPCFIDQCSKRQIPLVMLNGRMSPKSYRAYSLFSVIFAPLVSKFSLICAQSSKEADRYQQIVKKPIPTLALGNLKYDNLVIATAHETNHLLQKLNIQKTDLVLIAGSTHQGEDEFILKTFEKLKRSTPEKTCRLIIAPRHPERFERVAALIESHNLRTIRYSKQEAFQSQQDVLLVDTIGNLSKLYSVATVAFIGGSIAKIGGHNLLEPYIYKVPVVCGPHLFKTKETAAILKDQAALLIGKNKSEVEKFIFTLMKDAELSSRMGEAGRTWLQQNQGASKRTLIAVEEVMNRCKNPDLSNPVVADSQVASSQTRVSPDRAINMASSFIRQSKL